MGAFVDQLKTAATASGGVSFYDFGANEALREASMRDFIAEINELNPLVFFLPDDGDFTAAAPNATITDRGSSGITWQRSNVMTSAASFLDGSADENEANYDLSPTLDGSSDDFNSDGTAGTEDDLLRPSNWTDDSERTWIVVFKTSSNASMGLFATTNVNEGYMMTTRSGGQLWFDFSGSSTGFRVAASPASGNYYDGEWHVAIGTLTRTGSATGSGELFFDGVSRGTDAVDKWPVSDREIHIGSRATLQWFSGDIGCIITLPTKLSDLEIERMTQRILRTFDWPLTNDGDVVSNPVPGDSSVEAFDWLVSGGTGFHSSTDMLTDDPLLGQGEYTIAMLVNRLDSAASLVGINALNGTNGYTLSTLSEASGGHINMVTANGSVNQARTVEAVPDDGEFHLVLSGRDRSGNAFINLDGEDMTLDGSFNSAVALPASHTAADIRIGDPDGYGMLLGLWPSAPGENGVPTAAEFWSAFQSQAQDFLRDRFSRLPLPRL